MQTNRWEKIMAAEFKYDIVKELGVLSENEIGRASCRESV